MDAPANGSPRELGPSVVGGAGASSRFVSLTDGFLCAPPKLLVESYPSPSLAPPFKPVPVTEEVLPGRRRRGGGSRGAPAGHLHAERRAEALHDRVDARADDERGGPVVRRLLQVDDHEPVGQRRHVRRRDDAQRRAQGQADVRGAERALRGAPLRGRQAVVPIQYRVPHGAAARAARVPRRLERHAAQVHVVERLRAARLALLREDAAV